MYQKWLNVLGRHFFGRQQAGKRVRLSINRKFLDEHFAELGGTSAFVESLKEGPLRKNKDERSQSMYDRGITLFRFWKNRAGPVPDYIKVEKDIQGIPEYLPYLCLLCLAWTEGEEEVHVAHAFYDRLETLYPGHDLKGRLGDWCVLWEELEEWTKQKKGSHGLFVVERLGGMSYVGIPKSQVIFTPNRIESLPALFAALNLQPGTEPSPQKIRAVIHANRLSAAYYLGNTITELICSGTDIGDAAIAVILEHLADWDGSVPGSESTGGGNGHSQQRRRLMVTLEAMEPAGWRVQLVVEGGPETSFIRFSERGWNLRPASSLFAVVTTDDDQVFDAKELLLGLRDSMSCKAKYVSEGATAAEISFSLQGRKARYFDRWYDNRLLECEQLPATGGTYVLLTDEGFTVWEDWFREHGGDLEVQDYTENGLPTSWHLIHIEGLGALDEIARACFPGFEDVPHRKTMSIWLSSGTRIPSSVSRRLYAQYDPPLVHVKGKSDVILLTQGATSTEVLPEMNRARDLPGDVLKTFRLTVDSAEDVVVLQACVDEEMFAQTSFGVWIEHSLTESLPKGKLQVDRYGNLEPGEGVLGLKCPLRLDFKPAKGFPEMAEIDLETAFRSPAFALLESLSTKSKIPFPEFRRRAMEITKIDYWNLYQEARWLAYLAHVDLQSDSKGRWSHVIPISRQLMLSPWHSGEMFQAQLSGCGSKAQLRKLLSSAQDLGVDISVSASGCVLAPPRILLRHSDVDAFELVADASGIEWISCATYAIAKWSSSLCEWDGGPLFWYHHEPPYHESEYTPFRYQIIPCVDGADYASPTRLFTVSDPYAAGHRWHVLVRTNSINEANTGKQRYAFISDPSWAMWKTHLTIAEDNTIIPYYPATGSIVVPRILNFPYLLGRALCACSGLAPQRIRNVAAYMREALGVLPSGSVPYSGDCWEYRAVPRKIAEEVASKLSAELKDI